MASPQQSKSLALMFLLGAFLTGGALGFVADRAVSKRPYSQQFDRQRMQDEFAREVGLNETQRRTVDSIFDWRWAQDRRMRMTIRPQLDSIRDSARVLINQQLDASQQARFKAIIDRQAATEDSARKARGEKK